MSIAEQLVRDFVSNW